MATLTINIPEFDIKDVIGLLILNQIPIPKWLKVLRKCKSTKLTHINNIRNFINSISELSVLFDLGSDNAKSRLVHTGVRSTLIAASLDIESISILSDEFSDEKNNLLVKVKYASSILEQFEAENIISDWNYASIKLLAPFMSQKHIAYYYSSGFAFHLEAKENFLTMELQNI